MKPIMRLLGALLLMCSFALCADVPKLNGYRINDHAGLLTEDQRAALESKLEEYENETTNQFALLTVESLEGDTIDEYANRVFRKWGLGDADKDNGILVVFSLKDRKLRIEVGYGLEGAVPDATASQIRQEIAKLTKQNKYYEGFDLGFDSLIKASKGEYASSASGLHPVTGTLVVLGIVLVVGSFVLGAISNNVVSLIVCVALGALYGGFGWGAGWAIAVFAIVACVLWFIGMAISGSSMSSRGYRRSSYGGGAFDSFSTGSWSSGDSGSSGGGFSGGGGDSGGGGSSGDA